MKKRVKQGPCTSIYTVYITEQLSTFQILLLENHTRTPNIKLGT